MQHEKNIVLHTLESRGRFDNDNHLSTILTEALLERSYSGRGQPYSRSCAPIVRMRTANTYGSLRFAGFQYCTSVGSHHASIVQVSCQANIQSFYCKHSICAVHWHVLLSIAQSTHCSSCLRRPHLLWLARLSTSGHQSSCTTQFALWAHLRAISPCIRSVSSVQRAALCSLGIFIALISYR